MISLFSICKQISTAIPPQSLAGLLWYFITTLWPWGWLWIVIGLMGWTVYELLTWHGNAHYNSANGFSQSLNRFVGSGVYLLFQAIIYLILRMIFSDAIYCTPWPYPLHILVFLLTGIFLRWSGFWPR